MTATATVTRAPQRMPLRRTPPWWRDLAAAVTWGNVLVVIALWLSGSGARQLTAGAGAAWTSAGRLTGLLAADLLLMQVLLMARIPLVERSYGQDELARRHRLVGLWSVNLMLAHIVLITAGYAATEHIDVVHEAWSLVSGYGGMLLALVGTIALLVVAATSMRAARRKLRYESWHLLHLYAYVGVGLALPHQLWTGADFTRSHAATAYWWSAYGLAAGAVVLFRLTLPAWRSLRHRIVVTGVVRESRDVVTVHMRGRRIDRLRVRAGQFLVWRFLDGPGWTRGHPYSLSAAPTADHLQISVKALGDDSSRLARLRPGTRVLIEGPFGRLTAEHRRHPAVTLLACGIGITPVRALLDELHFRPGDATLFYRARTELDLVFRAELEELAQQRGVTLHLLTGRRHPHRPSWLPGNAPWRDDAHALLDLAPQLRRSDVYICGPDDWMRAVLVAAQRAGVPREHVHLESFSW